MIIEIPFDPRCKRAPKFMPNPRAKYPIVIDPDKDIKNDIAQWIFESSQIPEKPFDAPLAMYVQYYIQIPDALSNREKERRIGKPAFQCKKDLDNMQKLYQDALNHGILKNKIFTDDHIICKLVLDKIWHHEGKVIITIIELMY